LKEDKPKPDKFGALRRRAEEVLQRQPEELREMPLEDIQQHLSQTRELLLKEPKMHGDIKHRRPI
jgi:hypothetical protein